MSAGVRQQRGEATRLAILGVARRLFSEFGYHNTGIADIQSATGLTKGAFYHHFRAKQELALGVLELVRADYTEHLLSPAMAAQSPGRQLAALLDGVVELNERPEWRNCRLMATLSAELTASDGSLIDAVRSIQEQMLDTLSDLIGRAQQSGESPAGDPDAAAHLMLSAFLGLVVARKLGITRCQAGTILLPLRKLLLVSDKQSDIH